MSASECSAIQEQNPIYNSPLFSELRSHFDGKLLITRKQFRDFLQISDSTEWRMLKSGDYPKIINVSEGVMRIGLEALAEWLEKRQGTFKEEPVQKKSVVLHAK